MNIEESLSRLEHTRRQPHVSSEVEGRVQQALSVIERELMLVSDENGYERHLRAFIKEVAQDPEKNSCGCTSSLCALKHGQLPTSLRVVDDTVSAAEEYEMDHQDPYVLTEAYDEWVSIRKRVRETIAHCQRAVDTDNPDIITEFLEQ